MSNHYIKTNCIYINELLYLQSYIGKVKNSESRIQYCSAVDYVTSLTNYYQHINYTHSLTIDNTHNATVYSSASGDVTVKNQFVTVDETITITYND